MISYDNTIAWSSFGREARIPHKMIGCSLANNDDVHHPHDPDVNDPAMIRTTLSSRRREIKSPSWFLSPCLALNWHSVMIIIQFSMGLPPFEPRWIVILHGQLTVSCGTISCAHLAQTNSVFFFSAVGFSRHSECPPTFSNHQPPTDQWYVLFGGSTTTILGQETTTKYFGQFALEPLQPV